MPESGPFVAPASPTGGAAGVRGHSEGGRSRTDPVQQRRIEFLLRAVAESALIFRFGGVSEVGTEAAARLRQAWESAGVSAGSAEHFIAVSAALADSPDDPPVVLMKDGVTLVPLAGWLETALHSYDLAVRTTVFATPGPVTGLQRIRELLPQLEKGSREERERATRELIAFGAEALPYVERLEAQTHDGAVKERCAALRQALSRREPTALDVLAYIESADAIFRRPGSRQSTSFSPRDFSVHLQSKAMMMGFSLSSPAGEFITRLASSSSRHKRPYRVKPAHGLERDVAGWLMEKFPVKKAPAPVSEEEEGTEF